MHVARYGAAIALAWLAFPCAHAKEQGFTVKDDIAMVRFSYPRADPGVPGSQIAQESPDGKSIAIVTTQGLLRNNLIESRLLIFNWDSIKHASSHRGRPMPKPRLLATIQGTPPPFAVNAHDGVIKAVRWSADSSTIYFLAANHRGDYRLCAVQRDGGGLEHLTPSTLSIDRFTISPGSIIVLAAGRQLALPAAGQILNADARDITGARLTEVLFPEGSYNRAIRIFRLYTVSLDANHPSVHVVPLYSLQQIPFLASAYPFATSPQGKSLIKLEPVVSVPESWSRYAPTKGNPQLRLRHGSDPTQFQAVNVMRPLEYTRINLANGKRIPLLQAPDARSLGYIRDANKAIWSSDAKRVLITNTFLPVDISNRATPEDIYPCGVASVDLPDHKVRCLYFESESLSPESYHLQDSAFENAPDKIEVLLHNQFNKQIVRHYILREHRWILASMDRLESPVDTLLEFRGQKTSSQLGWHIFIHQTLNDPPQLWVHAPDGDVHQVWDPNPQFLHMQFGHASLYHWNDEADRKWSGILIKPVGYVAGKHYPLVLQMYDYVDHQFITDGLYPTAFAARELASAGFVVLQFRKQPDTDSERDPQIALEGYQSAVSHLNAAGMIDPSRVGVVGFSLTCWYVAYALVHDPKLFAAATIADGLDNSYMQFMLFTPGQYFLLRQMLSVRGVAPFGSGLAHWVKAASAFHFDRIQAPVRIEAIGPPSVLQEWDLYSSLRLLHRPVDLIYFPHSTHIHKQPLARLESQQGNVDWMCFWLKDQEIPGQEKLVSYRQWEKMRRSQGKQQGPKESVSR